ncbi:hypothetical protein [Sedimenticola selenatireducens]|uniref:Uncharacterized protein n=1 Tax=Sedimenticola selenatireducens TaxID=191960 RepID=A0A558E0J4_9GAMM|nr:hypothetical protein [Sedimenticola selenatireducens]TVO75266.1 hypothetical protein FHP88_09680 [Sedimenticola selenatireducens]TVT66881.1 MAG: hypothetical protein FHK78_00680 [Sedimenticola selenatireducens]
MQQPEKKEKKKWARLSVSSLEADVAYFDARLAMLDQKKSSYYQLAQHRAYTELERVLSDILGRLQTRQVKSPASSTISPAAASGIEVSEESESSPLNKVFSETTTATPKSTDLAKEDKAKKQE